MSILSSNGRSVLTMRLARSADAFAIGAATALPWSKTATSILIVLWLIALVPTLNLAEVRREIATPTGGLPILLFAIGLLGMAWANASWPERLGGFNSFIKFLLLPLFLVQFRRSNRGIWVMVGYLASCTVLLVVSSILVVWPGGAITENFGVVTNSAGAQCGEFAICSLALLFVSIEMFRRGRRRLATGALALALCFLANIFFIVTTNKSFVPYPLLIIPVLVPLLILKQLGARAMISLFAAGAAACAVLWVSSQYRQHQTAIAWEAIRSGDLRALVEAASTVVLGTVIEVYQRSAGPGTRDRYDTSAIRSRCSRPDRPVGSRDNQSAPANSCHRNSAWARRDCGALGHVDRASTVLSRQYIAGVDRVCDRHSEYCRIYI